MLVQMHDEGKLDAVDLAELGRMRIDVKIPGAPLVPIPLDIVRIGVDDVGFPDFVAVHFQHDFDVGLDAEMNVKVDFSPANVEFILKVVDPGKKAAQIAMSRHGVMFSKRHIFTSKGVVRLYKFKEAQNKSLLPEGGR